MTNSKTALQTGELVWLLGFCDYLDIRSSSLVIRPVISLKMSKGHTYGH